MSKDLVPIKGKTSTPSLESGTKAVEIAASLVVDRREAPRVIKQNLNKVGGDLVAGDKIEVHMPKPAAASSYMSRLIAQYKQEIASNPELQKTIAQLEHLISQSTSDLRDLETKLTAANRQDSLAEALELKENAAKKLMLNQTSKSAQLIFAMVLGDMKMRFMQVVHAQIAIGKSRPDIDTLVCNAVLDPAMQLLDENPLDINPDDLRSFLYLLTGNCHIRWD